MTPFTPASSPRSLPPAIPFHRRAAAQPGLVARDVEHGHGTPVVLLHSSGASGGQWRVLSDSLSLRWRAIAPDLCGYGASPAWHGSGRFTLAHEAERLQPLLGSLTQPVHLVGHSYGGAVALHLARMGRVRLRSLTLIEPVAFHLLRGRSGPDAAALAEIVRLAGAIQFALDRGDPDAGYGRFVDYWSGRGSWAQLPAARRAQLAPQLAKVALDFEAALNEPGTLAELHSLQVPTLLIRGARTTLPAHALCNLLATALPNVRSEVIDGAGHMAPLTHREAVNRLIAGRLAALEPLPASALPDPDAVC
jgi:pimeloyl-ACP methyl ester carboxylesterase